MEIRSCVIVGLGALGVMFGKQIIDRLGKEAVRYVADKERIARYRRDGVFCNGEKIELQLTDRDDPDAKAADLVIFAVKYSALHDAIDAVRNFVGERTVLLSLLNGITSEQKIGDAFGRDKVLYCVAQGMDAEKNGNRFSHHNIGKLVIGEADDSHSERLLAVADFFSRAGIPYMIPELMMHTLWNKLMLNVGVNQTTAVFGLVYRDVQKEGKYRRIMVDAMKETQAVAAHEGILLSEQDIDSWLELLDTLNPDGRPSMAQDVLAHRKTEAELFCGTIVRLGRRYGVTTPVNEMFQSKLQEIEQRF